MPLFDASVHQRQQATRRGKDEKTDSVYSQAVHRLQKHAVHLLRKRAQLEARHARHYYAFRVFHAGMATPVPVANGGTGASTAKAALNNLGIFYSATLPSSGTDGQICLVPV